MEGSPLKDVSVVEVASFLTGPFATSMLGDMGSNVLKIEPLQGDTTRGVGPSLGGLSAYFSSINRNKRYMTLNLKSDEGITIFKNLIKEADVIVENLKAGAMDRLGIGFEALSEINDSIIYCSIKGFHSDSTYAGLPAMDLMIQAMSGAMSTTGEKTGPPINTWIPIADISAAMYAAQSILAALYQQEVHEDSAQFIEIPMLDCLISWTNARMAYTFATGNPYPRGRVHQSLAPFGSFETLDSYIAISVPSDSLWENFCSAIEMDNLIDDKRFSTNKKRVKHSDQLYSVLRDRLSEKTTEEWFDTMREHNVPAAPVYNTVEMWDDPYFKDRNLIAKFDGYESGQDLQMLLNPVEFNGERPPIRTPPKPLGSHTYEVLSELGYSKKMIKEMRKNNVI